MLLLSLTLFLTTLYLIHKYLTRNYNYFKQKNVFSPKPIPIFGNFFNIFTFRETVGEYLWNLYKTTQEPLFGIFVFDKPHFVLRDPNLIKQILVKDFNYFTDRNIMNSHNDILTQEMLFFNRGSRWKQIRAKMTPVFTSGKLKVMFNLINNCSNPMIEYLSNFEDQSIEAKEVCAKFTTDVIAKCAFAINANCFKSEQAEFRRIGSLVFDYRLSQAIQQTSYFFLHGFARLFRMKFIDPEATDFMQRVFKQAIEQREKNNVKGNDLIDLIIDIKNDKEFSKAYEFEGYKVVAQAAQFFLAGFETTSSTMGFFLYEMARNPHLQTKVRQELKETVLKEGVTYDSVMDMKYLNMCVKEILRMYPVLPFLDRQANADYKVPGTDITIEKGMPVFIPMMGLHYDEKFFPKPHEFNPERFADKNNINSEGFSYVPFGEGPRNCIGERFGLLTVKLGLVNILSNYEVQKSRETPDPLVYEPKSFTLQSVVGLPLIFHKSPL